MQHKHHQSAFLPCRTPLVVVLLIIADILLRPLHLAAGLVDHPDVVEVLLEAGADPNTTNSASATPLFVACQNNNLFSARILLYRGYLYILCFGVMHTH